MSPNKQKAKGFVIAGTQSDIGKTSVSLGLMRLLTRQGVAVMPFKVGPDYIDPGHHSRACGRPSFNLDSFMCSKPYVRKLFSEVSQNSDMAIVEGVMGLFDGASPRSEKGSTAEIAKLLDLPVLLIINGEATARSAAALVQGFLKFDPQVKFLGVIANRVNHPGHAAILKSAIEHYTSTKFLGFIPLNKELTLPSRHLGLFQSHENREILYDKWADHLQRHIDVPKILKIAASSNRKKKISQPVLRWPAKKLEFLFKIAIARDAAFAFCYQDTLDVLAHHGGEIHFFSPLKDKRLPRDCDGLYFPGGYPELYAKKLSANKAMIECVKTFAGSGKVVVGECGGMMYLGKSITDEKNRLHPMTGLFNYSTTMTPKKLTLGYRILKYRPKKPEEAFLFRGHEFHYSDFSCNKEKPQMQETRGGKFSQTRDGYFHKNCFAFYSHIYWASSNSWLKFLLGKMQSTQMAQATQKGRP